SIGGHDRHPACCPTERSTGMPRRAGEAPSIPLGRTTQAVDLLVDSPAERRGTAPITGQRQIGSVTPIVLTIAWRVWPVGQACLASHQFVHAALFGSPMPRHRRRSAQVTGAVTEEAHVSPERDVRAVMQENDLPVSVAHAWPAPH